jgi:hypothetical protein
MVLGYHLVWTAYGWWLPNDLRGSTSRAIRCDVLRELGELHYGRKRVQPASRDIRAFYRAAAGLLKHPLLTFSCEEIEAIARAFVTVIARERYTCYACALLGDHVHVLIRKHRDLAEQMIKKLQWESAEAPAEAGTARLRTTRSGEDRDGKCSSTARMTSGARSRTSSRIRSERGFPLRRTDSLRNTTIGPSAVARGDAPGAPRK